MSCAQIDEFFASCQGRLHLNSEQSCCCSSHKLRINLPASCFDAKHCLLQPLPQPRCLSTIPEPQHGHIYVVSELSQLYFLSLADLSNRLMPTFHPPDIYFIFLGTRHYITFCPPGLSGPGGLSRSPSTHVSLACFLGSKVESVRRLCKFTVATSAI